MKEIQTYYTIELPHNSINSTSWVEYRGENVGYDWWNSLPIRFVSEEEAVNTINKSENYKNCNWRIAKTTVIHEVKVECKNS